MSNNRFIIPEYKIDLLNKSKKIIKSSENINEIEENKNIKKKLLKEKKEKTGSKEKTKKKTVKKKIRTLWVRRKKRN